MIAGARREVHPGFGIMRNGFSFQAGAGGTSLAFAIT